MKKSLLILVLCFSYQLALGQEQLRILVRGQEMVLESLVSIDGIPYVSAEDKSLSRVAELLGGESVFDSGNSKFIITTPAHQALLTPSSFLLDNQEIHGTSRSVMRDGKWYLGIPALARAYNASVSIDSDRNIWYIDPWIERLSLTAVEDKIEVQVESSISIQPSISRLEDPPRVVVDFPFAALSPKVEQILPNPKGLVERVEIAQFQSKPNIVRVVLGLSRPNLQWSTQFDEKGREVSIVIAPAANPVFQRSPGASSISESPSVLGGIELKKVTEGPEDKILAELKFSSPVPFAWRKLKAPDNRVYIDFSNCLKGTAKSIDFDSPYFQEIRVSQFQRSPIPVVRVVLQLRDSYHVDVESAPEGLLFAITSKLDESDEAPTGGGTTGSSAMLATKFGDRFSPHAVFHAGGIVIVIDPGHGGSDPGARGGNLVEKNLTLDIAERVAEKLSDNGFNVVLTRSGDYDVLGYHGSAKAELQARIDIAKKVKAQMFVSIHINSSDYSWPHGVQTHWYKSMDLPLATLIERRLGEESGFADRGVQRDRFYVLNHTPIPAVLVEIGFISNQSDGTRLADPDSRNRFAEAIRQGILDYSGKEKNAHL